MNPVGGIDQLVKLLQQRLARQQNTSTEKTTKAETQKSSAATRRDQTEQVLETLRHKIADQKKENKGDAELVTIFVETILAWQLGEDIIQDSGFTTLSKQVMETIELDPETSKQLHSFLQSLS